MISNPGASSPYSDAARKKFGALLDLYTHNNTRPFGVSFWKLGNCFDTLIDFLDTIDQDGADQLIETVLKQYAASLAAIRGYDNAWFDDFGWWSVAAQRAQGKAFFNANAKHALGDIVHECWSRFTANAPHVWERREPNTYMECGPVFEGGVWNEYWLGTSSAYPGSKQANPRAGKLNGTQNTVTNAIYLMAAQRIGQTDPAARAAASREWAFLLKWFDDAHFPLWWSFEPGAALVRERVGHFAKPNGPITPAPGFQLDWAWAGDQGLILGNLSDATLHLDPASRGPFLNRARQLIAGVCSHMTVDGVVQYWTTSGEVPDGDEPDYITGAGVFWRNALHVWQTNSDLRPALTAPVFQKTLRASADAAVDRSTPATFDTLANDTAVLVAASVMLPH